jgi:tRNA(adenine34) deaminase
MNTAPSPELPASPPRRALLCTAAAFAAGLGAGAAAQPAAAEPERRWYEAAVQMKRLAESWGDQSYGAVLVLGNAVIGQGPSRVVRNNDAGAHAEREALRDARERLGRDDLRGAVLYSTSRPCPLCEAAAAEAGVRRMYFGPSLTDAGEPRRGG